MESRPCGNWWRAKARRPRGREVDIRDRPQFPLRGTMVDTSHGPLPTEDEIRRQIDLLASFKANEYYLYSEASIEMKGYPLLNPEGRYSQEQIRRIVDYARERHVDVVPTIELYSHIHDLLRLEHYSGLGAFGYRPEVDPSNPEVMKVFRDWAGQIADLFPSPFVHIGFDETWQIDMAAKETKAAGPPIYLRVNLEGQSPGFCFSNRGKTVMAWGDIVVKYPACHRPTPSKGLVPVAWDYDRASRT